MADGDSAELALSGIENDIRIAGPCKAVNGLASGHHLSRVGVLARDHTVVVRSQRVVLKRITRHYPLRGSLIAPGQRCGEGVLCLLELVGRDQIPLRLRPVAIELLLGVGQTVFRSGPSGPGTGLLFLRVEWIEPGDHLPLLHRVAEPHTPFDQLPGHAK